MQQVALVFSFTPREPARVFYVLFLLNPPPSPRGFQPPPPASQNCIYIKKKKKILACVVLLAKKTPLHALGYFRGNNLGKWKWKSVGGGRGCLSHASLKSQLNKTKGASA